MMDTTEGTQRREHGRGLRRHAHADSSVRRPTTRRTERHGRHDARLHTEQTDTELLDAVRSGSEEAYAEIFRRYEPHVRRYAHSLTQASDVDDVVGEAFTSVYAALKRGKGPLDNPVKYLFAATRNTVITFHRQRERQAAKATRASNDRSLPAPVVEVGDELLEAAFKELSPRWRKVLWWAEVEGLTATEIGARLGIAPAAASSLTYRSRNALRAAYERAGRTAALTS